MTALAQLLFPVPDVRRSPATLFAWWERRRLVYNLIVGSAGLVTLTALHILSLLPPYVRFDAPWPLVILYGVCANLGYSLGFAIEALLERMYGQDVAPVGPTLFRHGLVFSVGLTLFPIAIATMSWFVMAVRHLFT